MSDQVAKKTKFSIVINSPGYQKTIQNTLGDIERSKGFVASITSAVAVNPELQNCESSSILAAALLGETLNLSPSPQLGQYYLVPFEVQLKDENGNKLWLVDEQGNKIKNDKGKWIPITESKAQFIMGYKGYIQLAIRSRQYKRLNVVEVKQGEFVSYQPFEEDLVCNWYADIAKREELPTIGYAAMFELLGGFRKVLYWTKEQMIWHADTYVPAFSAKDYARLTAGEIPDNEMWKYQSRWYKDFDTMAKKTMIRQLIPKWGYMSTEFKTAYTNDMRVINVDASGVFSADNNAVASIPTGMPIKPEATSVAQKVNLDDL